MTKTKSIATVCIASITALLTSSAALASEPTPPVSTTTTTAAMIEPGAAATAPTTATPERDRAATDKPTEHKHLTLGVNPLAATIGRYSIQVEYLPFEHHAIVLNPHFDLVKANVESGTVKYTEGFTGGGAELGYRLYTGSRGSNGFFVGPSLLLAGYSTSIEGSGVTAQGKSFSSIGGALDIGGQAVIGPGIVIGGGLGMQYTSVSESFKDLPLSASILAGGGLRPRFLLTVGYAFL